MGIEDEVPTLEEGEQRIRELCRSAELREPDRVVDYADEEYVALWDEEKVAVIIEVGSEEL